MIIPTPVARANQVTGMPEHPCETVVRNGTLICPYEEMEVRYFKEHSGLYLLTLVGEPFEIFGWGGDAAVKTRARASLMEGYLPVIKHETEQKGCRFEQTVFACLLEGNDVRDGTEVLVNLVKLRVTNLNRQHNVRMPVTIIFGSCFRPPEEGDSEVEKRYWKEFFLRDDMPEDLSMEREIQKYDYDIRQNGNMLITGDNGILFYFDNYENANCEFIEKYEEGVWQEGKKYNHGWRVVLELDPGETKEIIYKVPYLPLENTGENMAKLREMDFDLKLKEYKEIWDTWLEKGAGLSIPGTNLGNLWKAQTAVTFILVDKHNKGSDKLFGREMFKGWAGDFPDKVLSYVHLTPTHYEFIWSQEAAYWVVGMLDIQGYHKKAEEYLEFFFETQGMGKPGVHDTSILPDKNIAADYMGTTPHTWLNSNGGVLLTISGHYKLTKDKKWILDHKESIIRSCRWITELRKTTKYASYGSGYGLMPPGRSTDMAYASTHIQWYYSDIWSLAALVDIVAVLEECGVEAAAELKAETEDYRKCFLKSLDSAILDVDDFRDDCEYDFSKYIFDGPFQYNRIVEKDENGVPVQFKGKIISKDKGKELGLKMFVPMSPDTRVPLNPPYMDNAMAYSFGLLSGIINFKSSTPIIQGARHTGKQIWDAIERYCSICDLFDFDNNLYSCGLPYNDFIMRKFLDCDEAAGANGILNFVLRYGCDGDTHMSKETAGIYLREDWFQPCPFSLSMATIRMWIRRFLVFEDERNNRLVIGKAMPREWMENAAAWESPVILENAATYYGPVSICYRVSFTCKSVEVKVVLFDIGRLPPEIEIRINHPQGRVIKEVADNNIVFTEADYEKGRLIFNSSLVGKDGFIKFTASY